MCRAPLNLCSGCFRLSSSPEDFPDGVPDREAYFPELPYSLDILRLGGVEELVEVVNHQAPDAGAVVGHEEYLREVPGNGMHGLEESS